MGRVSELASALRGTPLVSSWKSLHGLPVFLDYVTWPLQSCQRSQSLCWSIQTGDQTQGFLLGSFLMGSSLDHEVGEWPCLKKAGWVSATKKPTRPCARSNPPAVVHELVWFTILNEIIQVFYPYSGVFGTKIIYDTELESILTHLIFFPWL